MFPQIRLEIAPLILTHSDDFRHRQLSMSEMLGQINKGMVFIARSPHDSHHRRAIRLGESVVLPIAPRHRHFLDMSRLMMVMLLVELYQLFHDSLSLDCCSFFFWYAWMYASANKRSMRIPSDIHQDSVMNNNPADTTKIMMMCRIFAFLSIMVQK